MSPREALAREGRLWTVSGSGCVHIQRGCPLATGEPDDLTRRAQIPLRAELCDHCDPDVTIERGRHTRPDVPAIEDHSMPWEAAND